MANFVAKVATKKILGKEFGPTDPYYETYTDDQGNKTRRKRAVPPGLSKEDASILQSVQKRASSLDEGFQICGLRVGYTFVIGVIPVVGGIVNLALSHSLIVKKAKKANIPASLLRKMSTHNFISAGMGMVPAVGDICVAVYKPNNRNAALLEEFLRIRGEQEPWLHPEEDEQSSTHTRKKRKAWFRRSHKRMGQENSASASDMNTPPGTGVP